jgi:hypothetical protein
MLSYLVVLDVLEKKSTMVTKIVVHIYKDPFKIFVSK